MSNKTKTSTSNTKTSNTSNTKTTNTNTKTGGTKPNQKTTKSSNTSNASNTSNTQKAAKNDKQEVVEKTSPNKETQKVGLSFDVNKFKKWIKNYFEVQDISPLPKFSGCQYILAASAEVLCNTILKATLSRIQKDTSGLYDVKRPIIFDTIKITNDLSWFCERYLDKFDPSMEYKFCMEYKHVQLYIEKTFGPNVKFDNKAFNLLAYLLSRSCTEILKTSFLLMQYSKKKSLDPNSVFYSVQIHTIGTLHHDMKMRIDGMMKILGKEAKEKKNDSDENENQDENQDENQSGQDGEQNDEEQDDEEQDDEEQNSQDQDQENDNDNNDSNEQADESDEVVEQKSKTIKKTDKKQQNKSKVLKK